MRFVWKNSGRPTLGLIAEDAVAAVNYAALAAVLVEAVKEQAAELAAQQAQVNRLERRLAEFETLEVRLNRIEGLLIERVPRAAASKP